MKMRCPTLLELPTPPLSKNGWPWTEETLQMSDAMPNGSSWPCISIVTPSYNQGDFIEETIRSVLLQGYPNLEYIIIDGGSTDQSIQIIEKYANYLSYWVSEPDKGQSQALNKGVDRITGDIFTFINSDDLLAPNVLFKVASYFNSEPSAWVLSGGIVQIDQYGKVLDEYTNLSAITWEDLVLAKTYQPQPGTFWRSQAFSSTGKFREDLHYYFDQEFFIRLLSNYKLETLAGQFAYARIHGNAKSQRDTIEPLEEKYNTVLNWLPKVRGKYVAKILAFRSIKLNYLSQRIIKEQNKMDKLLFSLQHPILYTSPSYLRGLFYR